ncbi:unnamed protein product [Mycena citricolor]|uniref:Peptide hydrolase n=1 Tax=Mycena citricolor TaxID=2018698 RepID=A0AAD2HLS1_9AGAR|nr:unnamed protein product [Mycena citricolor]
MNVLHAIGKTFSFRALPTTAAVVALYAGLLGAVFYGDQLATVPSHQGGLNLTTAYADLHEIAARPHPFLSHANDIVHDFILDRVQSITEGADYAEVFDDVLSNGSFMSVWGAHAVYNEATNVLVKIEGTDPEYSSSGGVLLSAHYDSVSSAAGATDDGMGVATLIQLVDYFTKHRPRRTVVFNINNGEEDGLLGAMSFLKHPWSNLTDVFLNLEGAASGGRPLLFRASGGPVLRAFHPSHPHANILSSDGFARGAISSGTDFTVYTAVGISGLDLAFYRGRSKYHTKFDSIPYTVGLERALWAMMDSARSTAVALANDDRTHGPDGGRMPVYLDLFGKWMVLVSMNTVFAIDIVLLVVGPLFLLLLFVLETAVLHERTSTQNGAPPQHAFLERARASLVNFTWTKPAWQLAKFWVAVAVTILSQALLVFAFLKINPFTVYSRPGLVVVSSATLAYLTLFYVLTPGTHSLPERQKHDIFVQLYVFSWLLLVLATAALNSGIGGLYFVTAWNAVVLLACAIGYVENMLQVSGSTGYVALPQDEVTATESSETTPLIARPVSAKEVPGAAGWWMAQLVLTVSVPVALVSQMGLIVITALSQTLADGSSVITVYIVVCAITFFVVLPVAPFTVKMHPRVGIVCLGVLIVTAATSLLMFPFSMDEPFKMYYTQSVSLGDISSPADFINATSFLIGLPSFIEQGVIPSLPSASKSAVQCVVDPSGRQALKTCSWDTGLIPTPANVTSRAPTNWLKASVEKLSSNSARFVLEPVNTRQCVFNFSQPIQYHHVHGSDRDFLRPFTPPPEGYRRLQLWTRTWGKKSTVDVHWDGDAGLSGQIACSWAEYESGSVSVDRSIGKIPGWEEILQFSPRWAAAMTAGPPVQAITTFSL